MQDVQVTEPAQQAVMNLYQELAECIDCSLLFSSMNSFFTSTERERIEKSSKIRYDRNEAFLMKMLTKWKPGETFPLFIKALEYNKSGYIITRLKNECNRLGGSAPQEARPQYVRRPSPPPSPVRRRPPSPIQRPPSPKKKIVLLPTGSLEQKSHYKNYKDIVEKHNPEIANMLVPEKICTYMPECFTYSEREDVEWAVKKKGRSAGANAFYNTLSRKSEHLRGIISALEKEGQISLRNLLENACALVDGRDPIPPKAKAVETGSVPFSNVQSTTSDQVHELACCMCNLAPPKTTLLSPIQWPTVGLKRIPICEECSSSLKKWSSTI